MWKYLKSWWTKPHWYHKDTVDMAIRFGQFFLEHYPDVKRRLTVAAALLVAELERLDDTATA